MKLCLVFNKISNLVEAPTTHDSVRKLTHRYVTIQLTGILHCVEKGAKEDMYHFYVHNESDCQSLYLFVEKI